MRSGRIKKKLDRYIEKSRFSNVAKSARRVFFNHLDVSTEERGRFHVDQMYGMGSGVLIRYAGKFFLLTARHVITNNIPGDFQNESPFWVTSKFQGKWESIYDFLLPKIIWNIGEFVSTRAETVIDLSDVCLIELFHPRDFHYPDHFIEIQDGKSVLTKGEYFEGQLLLVTGYPFEKNTFDFTPINEHFTHSTSLVRHTIPGCYIPDGDIGHISFEMVEGDVQHENVNGMSGGAIYNVHNKANKVKLAGITITAGNNVCRFIPSYIFIDGILNYEKSSCRVVDPIVMNEPPLEDQLALYYEYLKEFDPGFGKLKSNK